WAKLPNGNHNISDLNESGEPFVYKLAVRKTPEAWFFLAYDISETASGQRKFMRAIYLSVLLFSVLSLLVGWWAASRVMSPVSELAGMLRAYRGRRHPQPLAPHFPEGEVVGLGKALHEYSARLTEGVRRDREFNADVSHDLRTPLAVIRGATELLLNRPGLEEK